MLLQALQRPREQPESAVWEQLVALHENEPTNELGDHAHLGVEELIGAQRGSPPSCTAR